MAELFERQLVGSANTASKDDWYSVGALSEIPQDSPIPTGKKLWLGYSFLSSSDKALTYELRSNITGQTTGTLANTTLIGTGYSSPDSGTLPIDHYMWGYIATKTVIGSASNEKLWLRVTSGTNTVALFTWQIFYTYDF